MKKQKSFVVGAGKIILAISIVLWFLGSNGISDEFKNAEQIVQERIQKEGYSAYSTAYMKNKLDEFKQEYSSNEMGQSNAISPAAMQDTIKTKTLELEQAAIGQEIASYKLEHSYIGYLGKGIEPLVKPLGL